MTELRRMCFTVDLHDDPGLIAHYRAWHGPGAVPKPVVKAMRADDIRALEIWLHGTRMFLIMDVGPGFDPVAKAVRDADNPDVQDWDRLMRTFQKPPPGAAAGETWVAMDRIHALSEQD
ncbi:L-rhamnose mutarotase [Niveispirillum irakense]|uniref:L-rhamnose mutarotase n=1 Tax=Niveispirillum irakense TaxID=34011 RepID=UPI000490B4B7|nr:L-rhamnose mutarotase [Niveispirillum irakense]